MSAFEQVSSKFQVKVKNVHDEKGTISPDVIVRGIRWHIVAKKYREKNADTFAIYLYGNENDMDPNYGYNVKATFTLLSTKKEWTLSRHIDFIFHWRDPAWGFGGFITFSELINKDKQYVLNKGALIEVSLSVDEPQLLSINS